MDILGFENLTQNDTDETLGVLKDFDDLNHYTSKYFEKSKINTSNEKDVDYFKNHGRIFFSDTMIYYYDHDNTITNIKNTSNNQEIDISLGNFIQFCGNLFINLINHNIVVKGNYSFSFYDQIK